MAQEAGILDAYAAYGAAQHQQEYALLRKVSHWLESDVQRERSILQNSTINPTYSLERFDQLLECVDFTAFESTQA